MLGIRVLKLVPTLFQKLLHPIMQKYTFLKLVKHKLQIVKTSVRLVLSKHID